MNSFFIRYIRPIVYVLSCALAIGLFVFFKSTAPFASFLNLQLAQSYAFIAVYFLYFTLVASPLYTVFPNFPIKPIYLKARRALGLSVFLFACLHVYFAFFGLLGGLHGLAYLNNSYILAISLSFTALIILTVMAVTSNNASVKFLKTRWKLIHRFVYLAGLLIISHALLIGSNYNDLSGTVPQVSFIALLLLFLLELLRINKNIPKKYPQHTATTHVGVVTLGLLLLVGYFYLAAHGTGIGIHHH